MASKRRAAKQNLMRAQTSGRVGWQVLLFFLNTVGGVSCDSGVFAPLCANPRCSVLCIILETGLSEIQVVDFAVLSLERRASGKSEKSGLSYSWAF